MSRPQQAGAICCSIRKAQEELDEVSEGHWERRPPFYALQIFPLLAYKRSLPFQVMLFAKTSAMIASFSALKIPHTTVPGSQRSGWAAFLSFSGTALGSG